MSSTSIFCFPAICILNIQSLLYRKTTKDAEFFLQTSGCPVSTILYEWGSKLIPYRAERVHPKGIKYGVPCGYIISAIF